MDRIEGNDDMRPFRLLNSAKPSHGPRLGELTLPQRHAIETPHYIAVTSRGAVPHLTQDNLKQHSNIKAAYLGLEDCEHISAASSGIDEADELPLTEASKS